MQHQRDSNNQPGQGQPRRDSRDGRQYVPALCINPNLEGGFSMRLFLVTGMLLISVSVAFAQATSPPKQTDTDEKWQRQVGRVAPEQDVVGIGRIRGVRGLCRCTSAVLGVPDLSGYLVSALANVSGGRTASQVRCAVPIFNPDGSRNGVSSCLTFETLTR